jgi:hypothetical protein
MITARRIAAIGNSTRVALMKQNLPKPCGNSYSWPVCRQQDCEQQQYMFCNDMKYLVEGSFHHQTPNLLFSINSSSISIV